MSAQVRTPEAISGFIAIGKKWAAKATNITFDPELAKDEVTSLEDNGYRSYQPTIYGASFSCTLFAAVNSTGYTAYTSTGTTGITGGTTAYDLIEEQKNRRLVYVKLKIDNNNYQNSLAIIDSLSMKMNTGKVIEFDAKLTASGTIWKTTS